MNKVICDVCGTDYPETAAQCPICGCARGDAGQTSAGNASEEEARSYTYVKGGRFSKSNVRKRLKAQAKQAAMREEEEQRRPVDEDPKDGDRFDDHDEDDLEDDDLEVVSNKGLIAIVILLLLAIIAVSSYIAVTFFGGDEQPQNTRPQQTTEATLPQETEPSESEPVVLGTPCTKLVLNDLSIELIKYKASWELDFAVEPADTTDTVLFTSSDPSVVTVDDDGVIMGVGNGEATVTVSCGEFQAECKVVCKLQDLPTDPTGETSDDPADETTDAPTEPSETEPVEDPGLELKVNGKDPKYTYGDKPNSADVSLVIDDEWRCVLSVEGADSVEWTSADGDIATVDDDGRIVAKAKGKTTLTATVDGVEFIVMVRVSEE